MPVPPKLQALCLLATIACGFVSATTPCITQDFGIAYNGNKVFTVSSSNNTCLCTNYASSGLSTFQSAVIPSLTTATITATADSNSTLTFNSGGTFSGRITANSGLALGASASIIGSGSSPSRQVQVQDNLAVGSLATIGGTYQCGGLQGSYYQSTTLAEPPACSQLDATLFFSYGGSGPCNPCAGVSMACVNWGARWSGYIKAPITGSITLSITVDDGVRLWWNNQQLPTLASWFNQTSTTITATVSVISGNYYPVRIEYFQALLGYQLQLQWFYAGQAIVVIPSSNLCSASGVQVTGVSTFNGQVNFQAPALFAAGIGSLATGTRMLGPLSADGVITANAGISLGAGQSLYVPSGGTLYVAGATFSGSATFANPTTFTGLVSANGGLTVPSGQTVTIQSGGVLAIGGASVTGSASFASSTTFAGLITANGGIALGSAQTLSIPSGGTLAINGVTVSGSATFSGATSFTGLVTANGGITLGSTQTLTVPPGGTLALNGATVSGLATFSGTTSFQSLILANGGITVGSGDTLMVSSGGILAINGASITGSATFSGAMTFSSLITASAGGIVTAGGWAVRTGSGVFLDLGYNQAGRQPDAGRIGYQAFSAGLDIIGAGTATPRLITMWDNVNIGGNVASATQSFTGVAAFRTGCPVGWSTFNNICFSPMAYGQTGVTYQVAHDFCNINYGASLCTGFQLAAAGAGTSTSSVNGCYAGLNYGCWTSDHCGNQLSQVFANSGFNNVLTCQAWSYSASGMGIYCCRQRLYM